MAEVLEQERVEGEIPAVPVAPVVSLFGDEPATAWERMQEFSDIFKKMVAKQPSFVDQLTYGGKTSPHISIEGWVALGGLVGITARTRWTERVEEPAHGYKAMAEAVTLSGAVVAAHESLCLSSEGRWKKSDEYARKSMAQTRAKSQALATVLRPLAELAGFKGAPSEEMHTVVDREPAPVTERRVEGPKRERHIGWGKLLDSIDRATSGDVDGTAKGWLAMAALAQDGLTVTKPADLGEKKDAYFESLHKILWLTQDARAAAPQPDLYLPTQEEILAIWSTEFPRLATPAAPEEGGDAPLGEWTPDQEEAKDIPM